MVRNTFFNPQQLDLTQMLNSRITKGFVRREIAGRPDAMTLLLASGENLLIRNRSVELKNFDVGVLDFDVVDCPPKGSNEFELSPVMTGTRSIMKVLTSYAGDEFEVGIVLKTANALPFIIVPGGVPSTLALFGTLNREHEWVPEFEIREYYVEPWC